MLTIVPPPLREYTWEKKIAVNRRVDQTLGVLAMTADASQVVYPVCTPSDPTPRSYQAVFMASTRYYAVTIKVISEDDDPVWTYGPFDPCGRVITVEVPTAAFAKAGTYRINLVASDVNAHVSFYHSPAPLVLPRPATDAPGAQAPRVRGVRMRPTSTTPTDSRWAPEVARALGSAGME